MMRLAFALALIARPSMAMAQSRIPAQFVCGVQVVATTKTITDPQGNPQTAPDTYQPGFYCLAPTTMVTPALTSFLVAAGQPTPAQSFVGEATSALQFTDRSQAETVLGAYKACTFIPNAKILARLRALGKDTIMGAALQRPAYAAIFTRMLLGGGLCQDDADAATALSSAGLTPSQILIP